MTAKKIGLPVVDMACRSGAGLHFHAADWIDHDELRDAGECLMSLNFTGEPGLKQLKLSHDAVL